jgi:RluA family pseudouridine synthase
VKALAGTVFFKRNFRVLYEDDNLIACDKPYYLVVHPGTGHLRHDTLIELAQSYLGSADGPGNASEAALAHRLDRDTSGVICIAKDRPTLRLLHRLLRERAARKTYTAVCHGRPPAIKGTIDAELERTGAAATGTKMRVGRGGRRAVTHYKVTESNRAVSALELELETGRTHQLRVHCAHIDCPIVGDLRYGDREKDEALFKSGKFIRRLYLHARSIAFFYPPRGGVLNLAAPVPAEFRALLRETA